MPREAGGAVFLHPVCSDPFTSNEDTRTAKNGEGLTYTSVSVRHRQHDNTPKSSQRDPATRVHFTGTHPRARAGFVAAKVSCVVFVCGELASQRLIVGSRLLACIFIANGANFLVALAPDVTQPSVGVSQGGDKAVDSVALLRCRLAKPTLCTTAGK